MPEDSSTGIIIVISKLKNMQLMDLQYFITEVTPLVSGITRGLKDFGSVSFQIDYLMIDIITLISNVKGLYRFSSISRFTRSILKFQKLRGLVEVTQKIYNSSTLKSVSLKVYELMIGAKSVQAPIESCLEVCVVQKRNGSVYRVSYKLHS